LCAAGAVRGKGKTAGAAIFRGAWSSKKEKTEKQAGVFPFSVCLWYTNKCCRSDQTRADPGGWRIAYLCAFAPECPAADCGTKNRLESEQRRMMMFLLKAENRSAEAKPKQLRREGIVPGVLYGKELEQSLSIQFTQSDADRMLKSNSVGSRVELDIEGQKYPALLREVKYKPATDLVEHLAFQMLIAGEPVNSVMSIVLLNREFVTGIVHQPQSEFNYRALPKYLQDTFEIDLSGMQVGDTLRLEDLSIAKDPNIEILSPLDTVVLAIEALRKIVEEEAGAEDALEAPTEESAPEDETSAEE
jgi:large subunit ribosomal protein L25